MIDTGISPAPSGEEQRLGGLALRAAPRPPRAPGVRLVKKWTEALT